MHLDTFISSSDTKAALGRVGNPWNRIMTKTKVTSSNPVTIIAKKPAWRRGSARGS